jgi:DNA-directed RNA polymerase subunit K/omega
MSKRAPKKNTKIESDDEMSELNEETEDNLIEEEEELYEENDEELNEDEDLYECAIEKMIDDDNDEINDFENSEIENVKEQKLLTNNERISSNRLSKYEMVRILGERTKQLTMGAKPLLKNYESLSYDKIAEEELKLNMVPFKIKRNLPNGKYEIWLLEELYKDHLLSLLE